ncbi:MAG: glycosyltransferase [Candidatus Pacebacteria bacterium]|nr:glycosyltransferase [Candidatus Paceibacterota bacterium]
MTRRDLSKLDASSHAASELEYIIRSNDKKKAPTVPSVSAEKAMAEDRVFKTSSNRDVTRVLFISRNTNLLNPTQQSLDGYINISDLFDEVHILILRQGITPKNPVLRAADNVWIYTAAAKFWWLTPGAGVDMVEEQLEFAEGFRPDLIVARDPFESAVTAYKLGEKYNRPTQLHVLDDYSTKDFLDKTPNNFWRRYLPYFTVPKFESVRTLSIAVQNTLENKFSITDIETLPRYQNYEALIDVEPSLDLKDKYKPFVFIMLFVGKINHESTLYRAIDSARFVLRNPRVGMVVLGDGNAKDEFMKRAKLLGIDKQVVFETNISNIVPYLKSANLLLVTDTDTESEEVVMKGAAAGIPMVMSRTEVREDIFTHAESAFLCSESNNQEFTDRINDLLNDVSLRNKFISNSQDIIREKFHSDPTEYQMSYRASIEQAFFVNGADDTELESY